jgi:hypothetical protein
MTPATCSSYLGYRFLAEIGRHTAWLYACFSLSPRMVDER